MKCCKNCGTELEEGQVCGCGANSNTPEVLNLGGESNFFESMKNRMGIGTPEQNATEAYERGMKIVPECIRPEENEIPVKQYNVAVLRNLLKLERSEGRMQVTNKRVIFRATGHSVRGRTTLQHEFAIDNIAGIEARRNYKFSFLYLIFAILISGFAHLIITSGNLKDIEYAERIYGMMSPSHVRNAYEKENAAFREKERAEKLLPAAAEKVEAAKKTEEKAAADTTDGILKTRRVSEGYSYWSGEPIYRNETYRDKTEAGLAEARSKLNAVIAERKSAETEERRAIEKAQAAEANLIKATKERESTVSTWKIFMTLFGLLLGFGGLAAFFMLYQKFGLKLFILCFSFFGFMLSIKASDFSFFYLFLTISTVTYFVCMFIYCFRPNLVISVKNKQGSGDPIDIRRDTLLLKQQEKGTGFSEIIPTEETESAIREIGAIIGDIQKMGDLGIEKWKEAN